MIELKPKIIKEYFFEKECSLPNPVWADICEDLDFRTWFFDHAILLGKGRELKEIPADINIYQSCCFQNAQVVSLKKKYAYAEGIVCDEYGQKAFLHGFNLDKGEIKDYTLNKFSPLLKTQEIHITELLYFGLTIPKEFYLTINDKKEINNPLLYNFYKGRALIRR